MDSVTVKSWVTQPDACRCCLSANGTWDLTVAHVNNGVKEIYSDMFLQCFGLTLSHLSEWGPSRMICQLCVDHLREACSFRSRVVAAELMFDEHLSNRGVSIDIDVEIKQETEDGAESCDNIASAIDCESDKNHEVDKLLNQHLILTHGSERQKLDKGKRKSKIKKKLQEDDEWETPIALLTDIKKDSETMCDEFSGERNKTENAMASAEQETESEDITIVKDQDKNKDNSTNTAPKLMSEIKMVKSTCDILLRFTNACPFRHRKSWFQCFFCSEEHTELSMLRKHTTDEHSNIVCELKKLKRYPQSLQIDITGLKCIKCTSNFNDIETLILHFEEKHKLVIYKKCIADYKVDSSPYTCHICSQEFHVFRSLTMHLNDHYANCICDVCGKSFLNLKRLKVHKRSHENGLFPCCECGEVLTTKTSQANHMEKHSKRILKCQICSEPMKHYNDRIKHMSDKHNITHKFKCNQCPKEYNIRHYMTTHMRQTHGNKNKRCSECDMAFMTNHGLKKHMLKHTGEKPYSCNICSKAYSRQYTLKEHMRSHDSEKLNVV